MASRRKQMNPLKRAGLRILPGRRLLEEPASSSEEEEAAAIGGGLLLEKEEENMSSEGEWYDSGDMGARPKVNPQHATVAPPPEAEIVTPLRDFLTTQQRREDGLREEIQGLRTSFLGAQAGVRETVLESPRMALPTPAPRCRGARPTQSSPIPSSTLVVATSTSTTLLRAERGYLKEPKMPLYQQGEDMENDLLRFERMAKTWVWPEGQWACRLVPLLTGKALEAYTAMDEERSDVYRDLKEALLRKFDITPETYGLWF
ncbi:hypothetical protein AAFF_G00210230 [Aldrovandia affinis]|uniref:Uncharacterized protein n=1 Tax=Aldrovandia affinis TaxID=143900 RepID=A0AAD7SWA1_9TELE|nr:hypothetical protein AAFF_G00210230 [Aldrovandia affinis]